MKVLLVNTYAKSGGASIAARRLCDALNGTGTETYLLVQNSEEIDNPFLMTPNDSWASVRPFLDTLPVLPWRKRRSPHWGNAWFDNTAVKRSINNFTPDVTHLHWVNHGMLSLRDVADLRGPVVWTLHDSWVFTGGCHTPQSCCKFQECCGACPELYSRREYDLSRWNWNRKHSEWESVKLVFVTPSRWLADAARSSSLLSNRRIVVIPNAVDMLVFRQMDRKDARCALGLPENTPLFLFGAHGAATDWNKGMELWRKALPKVAARHPRAEAMLAGVPMGTLDEMPLPVHELGRLDVERMALAMSAADVVVVPSRMENLPTMVAESLACGTPVVAFATGGIPEMIRSGETGFLARPFDTDELARGICELLIRGDTMRKDCAAFAQDAYAPKTVARRHIELYQSLLSQE